MNVWAQSAARARARWERDLATALAFVHENYDEHATLTPTGVILFTLDGFDRLRAATSTGLPSPRNYFLPEALENVIIGTHYVELVTRMPGATKHRGFVQSVAGDRSTVRWDDGATSSVRSTFLRTLTTGARP